MNTRMPQKIFTGQIPGFSLKNGTDWIKEQEKANKQQKNFGRLPRGCTLLKPALLKVW